MLKQNRTIQLYCLYKGKTSPGAPGSVRLYAEGEINQINYPVRSLKTRTGFFHVELMLKNYKTSPYTFYVIRLIGISFLIKCALATLFNLGNVEAYYWVLSTKPGWNYFDHPPLVAWTIWLTTAGHTFHQEFFVRLGAIICSSLSIWLIYVLTKRMYTERAGWIAAVLYTSSVYASIAVGVFILPDSPEMVFWLLSLVLLTKLLFSHSGTQNQAFTWLLFGLISGLCIMSKLHGIMIWFGLFIYILTAEQKILKSKYFYLAMLVTLVTCSPILIWNITHDFANFKFQGARAVATPSTVDLFRLIKALFAMFFTIGPILIILIAIGLKRVPRGSQEQSKMGFFLRCCSFPLIFLVTALSIFRETYAHWTGPGITTLLIFPAVWLAEKQENRIFPKILGWTLGYALLIAICQVLMINFLPGTVIPSDKDPMKLGWNDPTLDEYGWKATGLYFNTLLQQDERDGFMTSHVPLIATNWANAAQNDYYISYPSGLTTLAIGQISEIHQYHWLDDARPHLKTGSDAYYIIPSNIFTYKDMQELNRLFSRVELAHVLDIYRSGRLCKEVFFYRLYNFNGSTYH